MTIDRPGFHEPVRDAQAVFRAVLSAMSSPGRLLTAGATLDPPPGLDEAAAAVLLTLVDAETPVRLEGEAAAAAEWVTFHCGAPIQDRAPFAVADELLDFATLDAGTDEAPERSATVIVQVLSIGAGTPFRLAGPGIKDSATLRVKGLPADFASRWAANHALFPRGVDLVLTCGEVLTALPRSVAITEMED
jgi:alpha-D-ribose 1-methylphosphonate 5-triphosphate synthase subunit PhnH